MIVQELQGVSDLVVLDVALMDVPLLEAESLLQGDVSMNLIIRAEGSVVPHLILPIIERYMRIEALLTALASLLASWNWADNLD